MLTVKDQIDKAYEKVEALFTDKPKPPPDATVESLWVEILQLRKLIKKPRVHEAVKIILEDPTLACVPVPVIANIIQSVYHKHGFKCNCSDQGIRWYTSQKTMEWNIVKRVDIMKVS